jgi:hypothetical protein
MTIDATVALAVPIIAVGAWFLSRAVIRSVKYRRNIKRNEELLAELLEAEKQTRYLDDMRIRKRV